MKLLLALFLRFLFIIIMATDVRPALVRYARIYQDYEDGCLYLRGLSCGHALVAQLVRRCSNGIVCVRKYLRNRRGEDPDDLRRAEAEFAREVRFVTRLQAVARATGKPFRVPRLLSSKMSGPNRCKVSYWELCNGGTLFSFLRRCTTHSVALPVGLALDFLRQVLETIEFLHTALETPVFHGDVHSANLALHFVPGRLVPELKLLDFGLAANLATTLSAAHLDQDKGDPDEADKAAAAHADPDTTHLPMRSDIRRVLDLLQGGLLPRVMLGRKDFTGVRRIATYLKEHTGDDDDQHTEPLRHAFHMLQDMDAQMRRDYHAAERLSKDVGSPAALVPVPMPPIPSLQPVIKFLRRAARAHDPGYGKAHRAFWDAVVEPARARAMEYEGLDPLLCMTPAGLVEILHDAGMKGPWDVAMVDAADRKMPVVGVLHGVEREAGRKLGKGEGEDVDEEEGEKDESGREYGELW